MRIRHALEQLATDVARPGRIAGKSVKPIKGVTDAFHRLRVGGHRVMYDVIEADKELMVCERPAPGSLAAKRARLSRDSITSMIRGRR